MALPLVSQFSSRPSPLFSAAEVGAPSWAAKSLYPRQALGQLLVRASPKAGTACFGKTTNASNGKARSARLLSAAVSRPDHLNPDKNGKPQRQLNPDWVEQLMGLPREWTKLEWSILGSAETEPCPQVAEVAFRTLLNAPAAAPVSQSVRPKAP